MKTYWKKYGKSSYTEVSNYISSITWNGSTSEATRSIELTLANSDKISCPKISTGDYLKLYTDSGTNLFVGRTSNIEKSNEIGTVSISAKDFMTNFMRGNATYKFTKKTPESIVRTICKDVGIARGHIATTNKSISKIYFEDRPYYEIIMGSYNKATAKTGKLYQSKMDGTKFEVIEKGTSCGVLLKTGETITNANYTESSDDIVNKVAIYDSNGKRIGTASSSDSISQYGIYHQTLTVEKGTGKSEAKELFTDVTKSATIEALGNIKCISGKALIIQDNATGLYGTFWILSDSHTWENGINTMSLELEFKNVSETYEEDEEEEEETNDTTDGNTSSTYTASSKSTKKGKAIAEYAAKFIGKVTYVFGASSPASGRSDCSGFTQYVFAKYGISIGRDTLTQVTKGTKVSKAKAQAGDLVFFKGTYRTGVSHVGIYVGSGKFINCGSKGVTIGSLSESYWVAHWHSARRVI